MPHPRHGSDQGVFLGSIESVVYVHRICPVESVLGQMLERDMHIHLDVHGCVRDGDECGTGQPVRHAEWWFEADQRQSIFKAIPILGQRPQYTVSMSRFAAYVARVLVNAAHTVSQPLHTLWIGGWCHLEDNSCFIFEQLVFHLRTIVA